MVWLMNEVCRKCAIALLRYADKNNVLCRNIATWHPDFVATDFWSIMNPYLMSGGDV